MIVWVSVWWALEAWVRRVEGNEWAWKGRGHNVQDNSPSVEGQRSGFGTQGSLTPLVKESE